MAMLQRPFIIVSSVRSQITQSPQLDSDEWVENGEGARGRFDHFAMLDFEGRPNTLMQTRMLEHKVVALALPDLVLLRDRLDKLIEKGVRDGVIDLTGYSGTEGKRRG